MSPSLRLLSILSWVALLVPCSLAFLLLGHILWGGLPRISWEFIFSNPKQMGLSGGIFPILVATALTSGLALMVVVPLGTGAALFHVLNERRFPRSAAALSVALDVLGGAPSIVFGMFGLVVFCEALGWGVSIASGSAVLAMMCLPYYTRSAEAWLRLNFWQQMKVAQGAGLAPAKAILAVILPAWTPGLIQSAVLTLGRSLAETAALLFTAGYVMRMPQSIFDPGRTVSVHIFELVMNTPGGNQRALAASAVMLGALFAIHVMAARMQERLHRNHL